jgi:hypothetical protein
LVVNHQYFIGSRHTSLTVDSVAVSTEKFAIALKNKNLYDMWIKQAGMWMKLGNEAKATEFLLKIKKHQKQEEEE